MQIYPQINRAHIIYITDIVMNKKKRFQYKNITKLIQEHFPVEKRNMNVLLPFYRAHNLHLVEWQLCQDFITDYCTSPIDTNWK